MTITLFEMSGTRSERAHWTALELGLDYERIEGREVFQSEALGGVHPLRRVPALRDNDRPLFESAAICNWLADSHPKAGLLARPGDWRRALHDQWVSFTLSELEAYLWSNARNRFVYSEALRVPAIIEQNKREAKRALAVIDAHLSHDNFLVDNRFSLTDIFVGYAVHWAEFQKLLNGFDHLRRYHERLLAIPTCPFSPLVAPD